MHNGVQVLREREEGWRERDRRMERGWGEEVHNEIQERGRERRY